MARTLAYLTLAALLCGAAYADSKDCHLGRYASLPITLDNAGLPTVQITIDGTPINMLVDTGASYSLLNLYVVRTYKLPEDRSRYTEMIFGGQWSRLGTKVPEFKVGGLKVDDHVFVVAPDGTFVSPSDGDLAADVLSGVDLDFDFAAGRLNLMSQDHCRGKVIYWTRGDYATFPFTMDDGRHIKINVMLDGKKVSAIVDTGSNQSLMSLEVAKKDFNIDPMNLTLGGGHHRFKELALQGIIVTNPYIALIADKQSKLLHTDGMPDMILGMDILRQLHLYIAYKEQMLFATAAEAR